MASCTSVLLMRGIVSVGSISIAVREQQALKKKMVARGRMPEQIWEIVSQSHNMSTLYACSLNRWELLQDTPGNWSNFQKASQAQHKDQDRVGEEDKEMLGSFSFWYYHGYPPKIMKTHCCTLNHCLNLTLALHLCGIGYICYVCKQLRDSRAHCSHSVHIVMVWSYTSGCQTAWNPINRKAI